MSPELYAAYVATCFVVLIVPGPTVTLIVANSLRHGTRAGVLNIAGTQLGVAFIVAVVGVGLASAVDAMGHWFGWLRLLGAAYLVWLGWRMIRAAPFAAGAPPPVPRGGFFLQGLLVVLSNPKALIFFGAFLPQFIDPGRDYALQIALLGATAMAMGAVTDGTYAALSGRAGRSLADGRARLLSRGSGCCLIGGGLWLALMRTR